MKLRAMKKRTAKDDRRIRVGIRWWLGYHLRWCQR